MPEANGKNYPKGRAPISRTVNAGAAGTADFFILLEQGRAEEGILLFF
jgi:hypothetical protein